VAYSTTETTRSADEGVVHVGPEQVGHVVRAEHGDHVAQDPVVPGLRARGVREHHADRADVDLGRQRHDEVVVGVGSAHAVELVAPRGDAPGRGEGVAGDVHAVAAADPAGDTDGVGIVQGGDEGGCCGAHVEYPT